MTIPRPNAILKLSFANQMPRGKPHAGDKGSHISRRYYISQTFYSYEGLRIRYGNGQLMHTATAVTSTDDISTAETSTSTSGS
jgi:hypothetical protein